MKRALLILFLLAICITGFLSSRGTLPFTPIHDSSMEPGLSSGSLLIIENTNPRDIEIGDIIVINVPHMAGSYINYPAAMAHRVIDINDGLPTTFRTAGDTTGEDPFTIRPQDIRGTAGSQIPYLGVPLIFLQSEYGLTLTTAVFVILTIFLYRRELKRAVSFTHRSIFAPIINEEKRSSELLSSKIELTERRMSTTEQALEKFAAAIGDYAIHLSSHTSAIQGLAEASQELKISAAEQNRVLAYLLQNVEEPGVIWKAPPVEKDITVPVKAKDTVKPHKSYKKPGIFDKPMPSGCALSREARVNKALAAQKEISQALHNLQFKLESTKR